MMLCITTSSDLRRHAVCLPHPAALSCPYYQRESQMCPVQVKGTEEEFTRAGQGDNTKQTIYLVHTHPCAPEQDQARAETDLSTPGVHKLTFTLKTMFPKCITEATTLSTGPRTHENMRGRLRQMGGRLRQMGGRLRQMGEHGDDKTIIIFLFCARCVHKGEEGSL